jgi:quercetin dioxygenase-like cupin family protein
MGLPEGRGAGHDHFMHVIPTTVLSPGRETVIHLADDLAIGAMAVDSSYWNHRAASRPELVEGRILSVFDYTATWSWWERHPVGDEFLLLISGDVDLLLDDGTERQTHTLRPGQAAIVPEGVWHRAVVRSPSQLLFVTPTPARTQHRDAKLDQ